MAKKKTTKKASKKTEAKVDLKGEQTNNIKEGLGDVVEKITEKTGIKKVVKAVAGDDCGCTERKEALNKLFKFKVECLDKYEYEILDEFYSKNPEVIIRQYQMTWVVVVVFVNLLRSCKEFMKHMKKKNKFLSGSHEKNKKKSNN